MRKSKTKNKYHLTISKLINREKLLIPINMRDGSIICIRKGNEQ